MKHLNTVLYEEKARLYSVPRVRLCLVSFRALSQFCLPVVREYQARADTDIIEATFDQATQMAAEHAAHHPIDAFISAGANASLLRSTLDKPVATIHADGYDILLALYQARRLSNRVGLVTYGATVQELDTAKDLLKIEISQYAYTSMNEARHGVKELIRLGHDVIVGSSFVVETAEQLGCCGILAYSTNSIRAAFENALELARVSRLETERFNQLNRVLSSLKEAVLAVDHLNRITAVNPAMEEILEAKANFLHGKVLDTIAPELSLRLTLESKPSGQAQIMRYKGQEWVATRTPIREQQLIVGAAISLQSSQSIYDADTRLRTQRQKNQARARYHFSDLMGSSAGFMRCLNTAKRYAATPLTLLIKGESGSGKELLAQAIHHASPRNTKPFIAINCAAFPESLLESELFGYEDGTFTGSRRGGKRGLLEAAHTGTLFLDEIGDMPLVLQTRLLRVLQEREIVRLGGLLPIPIDIRVIAATHRPLDTLVVEGVFRRDLYYRINTLQVSLPSLRERQEDIMHLAYEFMSRGLKNLGCDLDAHALLAPLKSLLQRYAWPGNIRELENLCERMAVYFSCYPTLEQVIYDDLEYDCPEIFSGSSLPTSPIALEERLRLAMLELGNNRQAVADRLGISRTTLWRLLRKQETENNKKPGVSP